MRQSLRLDVVGRWERVRGRFSHKPEEREDLGELCLTVSELGWQATVALPNEPVQTTADTWTDANDTVTAAESIRRAVRAISRGQRERIGSVRLAVADPDILLIDSRSARIRSTDPAVIAEAGCQELGADAVLHAFVPFGQSSEHEAARGIYAFATVEQVKDYLIGLDTLAPLLVELVPVPLLMLAGTQAQAFATFELRRRATTVLLADPDTGTVLSRELAYGRGDFIAAVSDATSVSAREAADGLQRRVCFQPKAGWTGMAAPMTTTERALAKLFGSLKSDLDDWMEHFVHHRLANAPARVAITGDVDRIRGLSDWIATALGVPAEAGADPHRLLLDAAPGPGRNLLRTSPSGLLTIGKTRYRYVDGRFRSDQPEPARFASASKPGRRSLSMPQMRKAALPAGLALAVAAGLWFGLGGVAAPLDDATAALAAAQVEDGTIRDALLQRARAGAPAASEISLDWSDKLAALAGAMPAGVRIGKIAVSGTTPLTDDKLVLEGEAVAASDNLAEISGIIEHLTNSPAFMRDVSAITFGGAETAEGRTADLLHFTINASLVSRAKGDDARRKPGR